MIRPDEFTDAFIKVALPIPGHGTPSSRWYSAHGLCWYWAYVFVKVMGGEIYSYQTKDGSGHCFVKYNGLFYDSESFEGHKSWKTLQRYMNKATDQRLKKHRSMSGFTKSWRIWNQEEVVFNQTILQVKMSLGNNQRYRSIKL